MTAQKAALKLTLLFFSGERWTQERQVEWTDLVRTIERETGRIFIHGKPEATSRVVCDAIRAALAEEGL